ncbi:MAG: PQQ-binding-like beta-propeller repeat protein, partial [Acidobacteria bacterium]|nr:PQQ-binding-like beta-propeller repeat protein [Acidobacteriota bacterium]
AFEMPDAELDALVAYAQTLKMPHDYLGRGGNAPKPRYGSLRLTDGTALEGLILNQSGFDASIRTPDGKIHLLRGEDGSYTPAKIEPHVDWASYHGSYTGNRYSTMDQIEKANVAKLEAAWFYPIQDVRMVEGTPVVIEGVMYVTGPNQVFALDAATGREIWRWSEPRTAGAFGDASIGINRGVAVRGDRVFTVTDHAHLVALDRATGDKLWDAEMGDYREHYGATAAPLVVGDLVIAGISGGDLGLRGFLDAYHVDTGERAWRFWTIPAPGEPGSETWGDEDVMAKGCGATWLTGSYDPGLVLLYWPTGNRCPDLAGDRRPGDNLFTNSVVALNPATGEKQWHFQFTPHDTHDWDAQEPLVLVDAEWRGRPRKLLVQANRNGFLYVIDRVTGEFLLGEAFAKQTWAKGFTPEGRPIVLPGSEPTEEGVVTCPAIRGATNWFSTAYNPDTKLFYLLVHESCNEYKKADRPWERGKGWLAGTFKLSPDHENRKYIRALDIQTGKTVWEYAQTGKVQT